MSRRTYRWDPELLAVVEVDADWVNPGTGPSLKSDAEVYGNLSPTTDGKDISSRTKHRRYMRENGVTLADDYKESWAKARAEREAFYRGEGTPESRRDAREDVGRALYEARKRRR